jgi:cobalamin biosynthesis protein CobD/CbiB
MAAMAGILGVQLEKRDEYCLGKGLGVPKPSDIQDGHKITQGAGALALLISVVVILSINK